MIARVLLRFYLVQNLVAECICRGCPRLHVPCSHCAQDNAPASWAMIKCGCHPAAESSSVSSMMYHVACSKHMGISRTLGNPIPRIEGDVLAREFQFNIDGLDWCLSLS